MLLNHSKNGYRLKRLGQIGIVGIVLAQIMVIPICWATDVYVIYSGRDKQQKKLLLQEFPDELKVKSYNIDLLAVADYSGKQKAITKFDRAKVIVIVNDRPLTLLNDVIVNSYLLVMDAENLTIKSNAHSINIVVNNMDRSRPGRRNVKSIEVSSERDLTDKDKLKSAGMILVDPNSISLYKVIAIVTSKLVTL